MDGDPIPEDNHVSRYCPFSKLSEQTGKPSGAAFVLRNGEPYISMNWLEFFSGQSRDMQIREIRNVLALKMTRIGATAKLAIYKTSDIIMNFPSPTNAVQVVHKPLQEPVLDPSHAGILDFDPNRDEMLLTLKLSQIDCEMVGARD